VGDASHLCEEGRHFADPGAVNPTKENSNELCLEKMTALADCLHLRDYPERAIPSVRVQVLGTLEDGLTERHSEAILE
jgi:hypothetical protein